MQNVTKEAGHVQPRPLGDKQGPSLPTVPVGVTVLSNMKADTKAKADHADTSQSRSDGKGVMAEPLKVSTPTVFP